MDGRKLFILPFVVLILVCSSAKSQDSVMHFLQKGYIETGLTLGYSYNFDDKVDGVRPPSFHFLELGFWKSKMFLGHHPISITHYFASDFGLNTNDFVVGPKVGGFFSILILGIGGELVFYTDFESGSLKFVPSFGLFTPLFKLTVNPHLTLTNKDFQSLNKGSFNLTVRVFRLKREDLN